MSKSQAPSHLDLLSKPLSKEPAKSTLDLKPGTEALYGNVYSLDTFSNAAGQGVHNTTQRRSASQAFEDENANVVDVKPQSGKRHRTSDWPLKDLTDRLDVSGRTSLENQSRGAGSFTSRKPVSSHLRQSKFFEGSMNDRVSRKPHPSYIEGDDGKKQRHDTNQNVSLQQEGRSHAMTHDKSISAGLESLTDIPDTSRQSTVFRFGKSLSAAFNPSNWKIFKSQESGNGDDLQEKIIRQRHENVEMTYKDMQQKGHFRESSNAPVWKHEDGNSASIKHDLGTEFFHTRESIDIKARWEQSSETFNRGKRYERVSLQPSGIITAGHDQSPAYQGRLSPPKSFFHPETPLPPNLRFPGTSQQLATADGNVYGPETRHLPSQKGLKKQQKLVKRVSDLEGKLEAARRQLNEALGEQIPDMPMMNDTRLRFKGTLATLPSEGCLLNINNISHVNADVGRAVSKDDYMHTTKESNPAMPAIQRASRKRSLQLWEERKDGDAEAKSVKAFHSDPFSKNLEHRVDLAQSASAKQTSKMSADPITKEVFQDSASPSTPAKQASKKRKNIGLNLADDESDYMPGYAESEDDDGYEGPNKSRLAGVRKLRKVDPHRRLVTGKIKGNNETFGDEDGRAVLNKRAPPKTASGSRNIKRGLQYTSPPKPSSTGARAYQFESNLGKNVLQDDNTVTDNRFTAPTAGIDVPPVPEIPKTVRMASGELVKIPAAAVLPVSHKFGSENIATRKVSKLAAAGKHIQGLNAAGKKEEKLKPEEFFDWDADVF